MNVDATLDRGPVTLVWIDSRDAVIARWQHGEVRLERMPSEVPPHHQVTGHVRHDPTVRHGGGKSQTAGEPHRLEHLRRFVSQVADRVEPADDLLVLGPGTVHERLARTIADRDAHHHRRRDVACETSPPITNRQLVARLHAFAGVEPRRHTVGAYRWDEEPTHRPSGKALRPPRRVVDKPAHERQPDEA